MSLVKCAKCGKLIEQEASACPECGFIPDDLNNAKADDSGRYGRVYQWLGIVLVLGGLPLGILRGWDFLLLIPVGVGIYIYGRFVD